MPAVSRFLIAVVTTSVVAATLTATSATAASPSGVTSEQVVTAAASARANIYRQGDTPATRALASRACALDPGTHQIVQIAALAGEAGQSAEALFAMTVYVDRTLVDEDDDSSVGRAARVCLFGAVGSVDPAFSLRGNATVDYVGPRVHPMSGDAFVTPPIIETLAEYTEAPGDLFGEIPFAAAGQATKSSTTTTTVTTPRTTTQKKAAKKAYSRALKSAKKTYATAVEKADGNKKKMSAAKKAYAKKKLAATKKYTKAIAPSRTVTSATNTENRPFSLSVVVPTE